MIKNLVFDLGGVLLHLNQALTHQAFQALMPSAAAHERAYQDLLAAKIFEKFEIGAIDAQTFVEALQKTQGQNPASAEAIVQAWNCMLLDFPPQHAHLLKSLKEQGYRLFLLSNINALHLEGVRKNMAQSMGEDFEFDALFERVFYSHLIGKRKPYLPTFHWVLEQIKGRGQETLFIDDLSENVLAAQAAGWQALQHPANGPLEQSLSLVLGQAQPA